MAPVILTLHAGPEDYQFRLAHGPDGRILRMLSDVTVT